MNLSQESLVKDTQDTTETGKKYELGRPRFSKVHGSVVVKLLRQD